MENLVPTIETAENVKEKMFAFIDSLAIHYRKVIAAPKLMEFKKSSAKYRVWIMPLKDENGHTLNVIYYLEHDLMTLEVGKIDFSLLPVGAIYSFGTVGVCYNNHGNLEHVLYCYGNEKPEDNSSF